MRLRDFHCLVGPAHVLAGIRVVSQCPPPRRRRRRGETFSRGASLSYRTVCAMGLFACNLGRKARGLRGARGAHCRQDAATRI